MGTSFVTATGLIRPVTQPSSQSVVATIAAGTSRKVSDLVGFHFGDSVLIQHTFGTGLIFLGGTLTTPLFLNEDWQSPTYTTGYLVGQNGWVNSALFATVYGDTLVSIPAGPNVGLPQALQAAVLASAHGGAIASKPFTTAIGATDAFHVSFPLYIAAAGTNAYSWVFSVDDGVADMFRLRVYGDGSLTFNDNAGGSVYAGAGKGLHQFDIWSDAAGVLTLYEDGALIHTGARVVTSPTGVNVNFGPTPETGGNVWAIGQLLISGAIPFSTGYPIPNGTGLELDAHLKPINLSDMLIACAGPGAATINVLVLGY